MSVLALVNNSSIVTPQSGFSHIAAARSWNGKRPNHWNIPRVNPELMYGSSATPRASVNCSLRAPTVALCILAADNMQTKVARTGKPPLERLCKQAAVGARRAPFSVRVREGIDGIQWLEAHVPKHGFSLHRHDTYAIGMTLFGVQTFRYRGRQRRCLPGQFHVLHPDELHDGSSTTDEGFRYRIAYLDPYLIQQAIGGRVLPFVEDPVPKLSVAQRHLLLAACDMGALVDEMRQVEIVTGVAEVLEAFSAPRARRRTPLHFSGLLRVRDLLATTPAQRHSVRELERVAELDRWNLAREFRAAFGTSPTRFRTMRQLDEVRRLAKAGASLIDASLQAGFSDQSHMSRTFKHAYGRTPRQWLAAQSSASG